MSAVYEDRVSVLLMAAERVETLLSTDSEWDGIEDVLRHLVPVFTGAAEHMGLCCTLDCSEHGALLKVAAAVLDSSWLERSGES